MASVALGATALAARSVLRLFGASYRLRPVGGWERLGALAVAARPVMLVFWHDQILLSFKTVFRLCREGLPISVMVSQSRDGELAARVIRPWGLNVTRGSASRGGKAAMRALYRDISRHRRSTVIMPDGPRGPLHRVKPGTVVLAQMSRIPVVPMGFAARRSLRLGSWDRLHLALPSTRLAVAIGEPYEVPRELDDGERERQQERLAGELHRLTREAAASVGRPQA